MEKLKSTLARTEGRADQLQDALRESERVHQLAMKEGNKKETAAESPPTLTPTLRFGLHSLCRLNPSAHNPLPQTLKELVYLTREITLEKKAVEEKMQTL